MLFSIASTAFFKSEITIIFLQSNHIKKLTTIYNKKLFEKHLKSVKNWCTSKSGLILINDKLKAAKDKILELNAN